MLGLRGGGDSVGEGGVCSPTLPTPVSFFLSSLHLKKNIINKPQLRSSSCVGAGLANVFLPW